MSFVDKLEALVQLILDQEFNEKEQAEIDTFFNEVYPTSEFAPDLQAQFQSLPELQSQCQLAPEQQSQCQLAPESQLQFESIPELQLQFQSAPEFQHQFQSATVFQHQFQLTPELQFPFQPGPGLQFPLQSAPELQLQSQLVPEPQFKTQSTSNQTYLPNPPLPTPVTESVPQPPSTPKRKRTSVTKRAREPSSRKRRERASNTEPRREPATPIKRRKRHPIPLKKQLVANKHARNKGETYATFQGKVMPPREQGPPCGPNCRFKCAERIEPVHRELLFREFWSMADHKAQWDFIARNMCVMPKVHCTTTDASRRTHTRKYTFEVEGRTERICRPMFLNTLGISNQWVATVCKKLQKNGFVSDDGRGKHNKKKTGEPE